MITIETVEHVAALARLGLTEEEKERLVRELSQILAHVEKLRELPTEDVPPTFHVLPLSNVFRDDRAREPMNREEVLSNAPDAMDGCFRVPRVLEG